MIEPTKINSSEDYVDLVSKIYYMVKNEVETAASLPVTERLGKLRN